LLCYHSDSFYNCLSVFLLMNKELMLICNFSQRSCALRAVGDRKN
jgi:hypothetical protein